LGGDKEDDPHYKKNGLSQRITSRGVGEERKEERTRDVRCWKFQKRERHAGRSEKTAFWTKKKGKGTTA